MEPSQSTSSHKKIINNYCKEIDRIKSFQNYKCNDKGLYFDDKLKRKYARVGLYSTNNKEEIKCAFCHFRLIALKAGDTDPVQLHNRFQSACEFYRLGKTENEAIDKELVEKNLRVTPSYPQYRTFGQRFRTFANLLKRDKIDYKLAEDLAYNGYFKMIATKTIICFYCSIKVCVTEPLSTIVNKHRSENQYCPYQVELFGIHRHIRNFTSFKNTPWRVESCMNTTETAIWNQMENHLALNNRGSHLAKNDYCNHKIEEVKYFSFEERLNSLMYYRFNDKNLQLRYARAGLYWTKNKDELKCIFCRTRFIKLKPDDSDPMALHYRFQSACIFYNFTNEHKTPPEFEETERSSLKSIYPMYESVDERLKSFNDLMQNIKLKNFADDLSFTGYFYRRGAKEIQCVYCGVKASLAEDLWKIIYSHESGNIVCQLQMNLFRGIMPKSTNSSLLVETPKTNPINNSKLDQNRFENNRSAGLCNNFEPKSPKFLSEVSPLKPVNRHFKEPTKIPIKEKPITDPKLDQNIAQQIDSFGKSYTIKGLGPNQFGTCNTSKLNKSSTSVPRKFSSEEERKLSKTVHSHPNALGSVQANEPIKVSIKEQSRLNVIDPKRQSGLRERATSYNDQHTLHRPTSCNKQVQFNVTEEPTSKVDYGTTERSQQKKFSSCNRSSSSSAFQSQATLRPQKTVNIRKDYLQQSPNIDQMIEKIRSDPLNRNSILQSISCNDLNFELGQKPRPKSTVDNGGHIEQGQPKNLHQSQNGPTFSPRNRTNSTGSFQSKAKFPNQNESSVTMPPLNNRYYLQSELSALDDSHSGTRVDEEGSSRPKSKSILKKYASTSNLGQNSQNINETRPSVGQQRDDPKQRLDYPHSRSDEESSYPEKSQSTSNLNFNNSSSNKSREDSRLRRRRSLERQSSSVNVMEMAKNINETEYNVKTHTGFRSKSSTRIPGFFNSTRHSSDVQNSMWNDFQLRSFLNDFHAHIATCIYCDHQFEYKEFDEQILKKHSIVAPYCILTETKHPYYGLWERRIHSFTSIKSKYSSNKNHFSEHGFFYNLHNKSITCYSCGFEAFDIFQDAVVYKEHEIFVTEKSKYCWYFGPDKPPSRVQYKDNDLLTNC